ncbi:EAL domain-containing protein [Argonema antarcticum A004/B2]|uniref:putative bifunctional diguanylate cyclase/phosphodiesterase n=1 Tax=Argonema antarcticum TaxID=2942763 RepID=UPI0030D9A7A1|nr:EAL domain-containing protein [Argonema antarcticum A004/B2]
MIIKTPFTIIPTLERSYPNPNIKIPKNSKLIAFLQDLSKSASIAVFLIGFVVIMGWMFDITMLKSVLPRLVTMKANTAIGFLLSGASLWLLHKQQVKSVTRLYQETRTKGKKKNSLFTFVFYLLPYFVILIGLLTLIQYGFDFNIGIDQFFFKEDANAVHTYAPGRMAPSTAASFILLGFAVLLLTKKLYSPAQSFSLIAFLVAFLGLLGYLYDITSFYGIGSYTGMALHTSVAFILLSFSILFACPDRGFIAIATSELAGGIMIRRLSAPVIGIPPILCWLILLGERSHLYESDVGMALFCVLNIVFLATVIWWNARTLGAVDYQALHDLLTGLPNRILFNERLLISLANARSNREKLAVMFLDLDRFKKINDTLGHEVGDRLLKVVALRLTSCIRDTDILARWGGDEFTLLLPNISGAECSAEIAQKILDTLKPPFFLSNNYFHITSSIGIALYPDDGEDAETLIKNADAALYSAKAKGRNNYQFYTRNINEQASELLFLENRLHHAWERGEFLVYYQPKVNVNTGKITGMEALVRWQSPELGFVSPGKFIPIAEENGLIVPIGAWVLRTACTQSKAWLDAGLSPILMAVNLSARQLQQPDLVEMVAQILAETNLEPRFLELEITETTAMQNVDFTKEILRELNRMGVRISIDDFGTGYSSLNYLKNFPIHTIKIDRSFVRDMAVDPYDVAIASAVVALGKSFNMSVVAEGVETVEQLECLHKLGCEEMQGYLFSKPLPDKDAIALLRKFQLHTVKIN